MEREVQNRQGYWDTRAMFVSSSTDTNSYLMNLFRYK